MSVNANTSQAKPSILLMFSGGLDSLGALHVLLTHSDYAAFRVHAHHVHLHNSENRARAEKAAVEAILGWYRSHGYEVDYSETSMSFPSFNNKFPWDNDITKFVGGFIAFAMPTIKHVAFGVTRTDDEEPSNRIARGNQVYAAFTDTERLYPVRHLSKRDVLDLLPADLAALAWSCRRPVYTSRGPVPCQRCKTCVAMDLLRKPPSLAVAGGAGPLHGPSRSA